MLCLYGVGNNYLLCLHFFFKLICSKYLQILQKKRCVIEPKIRAEINYYYKLYFKKTYTFVVSLVLLVML